jgi:hypothetical protein
VALKGDDAQVFYSQKVDEIVPNIRYCNYKLGDKTAQKDLIDMKLKSGAGSELADTIDVIIIIPECLSIENCVHSLSICVYLWGIYIGFDIANKR